MRLAGESAATWRALKEVAASEGIVLDGIDELIAFGTSVERATRDTTESTVISSSAERRDDWDSVFSGIDFSIPSHSQ